VYSTQELPGWLRVVSEVAFATTMTLRSIAPFRRTL
jgi:hypothetical protein